MLLTEQKRNTRWQTHAPYVSLYSQKTKFGSWTDKGTGGRIYYFEIIGKFRWKAQYLKEVDKDEITIRFWLEIYDERNILREIHEKYPVDKGHKKIENDN